MAECIFQLFRLLRNELHKRITDWIKGEIGSQRSHLKFIRHFLNIANYMPILNIVQQD